MQQICATRHHFITTSGGCDAEWREISMNAQEAKAMALRTGGSGIFRLPSSSGGTTGFLGLHNETGSPGQGRSPSIDRFTWENYNNMQRRARESMLGSVKGKSPPSRNPQKAPSRRRTPKKHHQDVRSRSGSANWPWKLNLSPVSTA